MAPNLPGSSVRDQQGLKPLARWRERNKLHYVSIFETFEIKTSKEMALHSFSEGKFILIMAQFFFSYSIDIYMQIYSPPPKKITPRHSFCILPVPELCLCQELQCLRNLKSWKCIFALKIFLVGKRAKGCIFPSKTLKILFPPHFL